MLVWLCILWHVAQRSLFSPRGGLDLKVSGSCIAMIAVDGAMIVLHIVKADDAQMCGGAPLLVSCVVTRPVKGKARGYPSFIRLLYIRI